MDSKDKTEYVVQTFWIGQWDDYITSKDLEIIKIEYNRLNPSRRPVRLIERTIKILEEKSYE